MECLVSYQDMTTFTFCSVPNIFIGLRLTGIIIVPDSVRIVRMSNVQ